MDRIGVVGIVVKGTKEVVLDMQKILSDYQDIIIGRMGIPEKQYNIAVISLIVQGSNERISALTGKLGRLNNIAVKSSLLSVELE